MRNLKRVLSLALACIMVIGMMVMTTSAADFGDETEITYVEAVEVMSALGVLEGDDYGNFNPTDILTREQAAKIIAYMLLGKDNAEKLNANNTVFKDVAAGRWSAGYISYCTTLGILAGVGDGNFDPAGELTGVAFGKMLLVALNYDPKIEGYVGADWATNIATDIIGAGIDVKGVTMSEPLTREQAAQMALQTLEADIVDYANRGFEVTLSDGQTVIAGASKAEPKLFASYDYTLADSAETASTLQFCEKYYEAGKNDGIKLLKDEGATDAYGRPGYEWCNGISKPIIMILDNPVATYTAATKADVIAADLNGYSVEVNGTTDTKINNLMDQTVGDKLVGIVHKTTVAANDTIGDVNFATAKTIAEAIAGETNNGKVVEIYARGRDVNKIIEVEYTVAKLTNIISAKDKTVYDFTGGVSGTDFVNDNLTDTIKFHGDVARGSYVTVVKTGSVYQVYPTTAFTGTQTAYTTRVNTIVVDGETYKVGTGVKKADGANNTTGTDFSNNYKDGKYFVDQFGYVVAAEDIASNEYVYIVGADATVKTGVDGASLTVEVRAVMADGTTGVYNVPVTVDRGTWKVKHTNIALAAAASLSSGDEATIERILADKIYGYVVSGTDLMLEELDWYDGTETVNGGVYRVELDAIKKGDTKYQDDSRGIYLVDDDTVFVVYDAQKKKVETYVGADALPAYFDGTTHNDVPSVMRLTDYRTSEGLVSVVFIETSSGVAAEAIDEYVYVGAGKYTETLANGRKTYTYSGVKANGEVIDVTTDAPLAGNNVYAYDADCKIVDDLNDVVVAGTVIDARSGMSVVGTLVNVSGTYYQLTDKTAVVYVDDTLIGDYDGEGGWLVLDVVNNTPQKSIQTIFVTDDI